MHIIVDTREQRPLEFKCACVRKALKFGDYGAEIGDYQIPVVFERKSKSDLYGSLTQGYERLRRVFERAEKANFRLIIVIEATKQSVLLGCDHSARDPESIIKQLETIKNKYGVAHYFFKTRHQMSEHIESFFLKEYERCQKDTKGEQ